MWKFLFHNFTKCCIVQQLPAPGYMHAVATGILDMLIIQLALTISFLPFGCSSFLLHPKGYFYAILLFVCCYITWAAYKYEIHGAQSITSCLITGNDRCPHSTLTGASPLKMWHMDKLTDVPNRKFTTWERHWGPSVAVHGSSPSALLILHQKRLCHTPLPHLRSASPPFTHNSTPTPFSLYGTLSQINAEGLTWKSID